MNWLQIKPGCRGLPSSGGPFSPSGAGVEGARRGWKVAEGYPRGHLQVHGQLKQQPRRDAGHAAAGMSLQSGPSLWAMLLKPERTCSRASQEALFRGLHLSLRKCSISCTFKIALGWWLC